MKWIVAVGIVGVGLAMGLLRAGPDTSLGRPLPEQVGKVLTIRQGSRPPEKFVTVRAWERPDKTVIRYLRSEETQEMATLVETPNSTQAQLYRWGPGRNQPPPGVPTIPEVSVQGEPQALPEKIAATNAAPVSSAVTGTQSISSTVNPPATFGERKASSVQSNPFLPAGQRRDLMGQATGDSAGKRVAGEVHPGTPGSTPVWTRPSNSVACGSAATGTSVQARAPVVSVGSSPQGNCESVQKAGPAAGGNQAPPDPTVWQHLAQSDRVGDVITLHFPDKGVQRCVIVRKIVARDGTITFTVRSESSGELMTVTTAPIAAPLATVVPSSGTTPAGKVAESSAIQVPSSAGRSSDASTAPTVPPVILAPEGGGRESLWSRLTRRGAGNTQVRQEASGAVEAGVPTPVLAPPPREGRPDPSQVGLSDQMRVVVGPISPGKSVSPPSDQPSGVTATPPVVSSPPIISQPPSGSANAIGQNATGQNGGSIAGRPAAPQATRRPGFFTRLFRRDSDSNLAKPNAGAASENALSSEQLSLLQHRFTQISQAAAVLPVKRVGETTLVPPVKLPPPLSTRSGEKPIAASDKPDPLREPEKFVKHSPIRQVVTNAGLTAASPAKSPATLPELPGSGKTAAGGSSHADQPAKASVPTTPPVAPRSTSPAPGQSAVAPVPLPLVPMVTDKARPDLPPPQPPIQPFNTMQVASVQNPHQFPSIVPPVASSPSNRPALPVLWTRGPVIPPHQSPVQPLIAQASRDGTEALALRNTLFLVNVLQSSGSPRQREWAAARLAVIDPSRYPFAVEALAQAARHDPHPAVRIKAIQSLGLMRADTAGVRETLQLAARDADPRIREQARAALQLIGNSKVVPAGYSPPSK